jgi:prepilin-type N-terminal cleavage/methylation domain-containing protein
MSKKAFTLIEILLVIGLIVILAGALIVAINPGRQLAKARDTRRSNDISQILTAIRANETNNGKFTCDSNNPADTLPTTTATITSDSATNNLGNGYFNLGCLIPDYTPKLPIDPSADQNGTITDYTIIYNTSTRLIKICAPRAETQTNLCKES